MWLRALLLSTIVGATPAWAITGGQPEPPHSSLFRSTVILHMDGFTWAGNKPWHHRCTGSIISEIHILTAAHCFATFRLPDKEKHTHAAIHVPEAWGKPEFREDIAARRIDLHPKFTVPQGMTDDTYYKSNIAYDVAVVTLARPISARSEIMPAYPASKLRPGQEIFVAGYGIDRYYNIEFNMAGRFSGQPVRLVPSLNPRPVGGFSGDPGPTLALGPPAATFQLDNLGAMQARIRRNQECLTSASDKEGAALDFQGCGGGWNQRFTMIYLDDHVYQFSIQPPHAAWGANPPAGEIRLCLDLGDGTPGTALTQRKCGPVVDMTCQNGPFEQCDPATRRQMFRLTATKERLDPAATAGTVLKLGTMLYGGQGADRLGVARDFGQGATQPGDSGGPVFVYEHGVPKLIGEGSAINETNDGIHFHAQDGFVLIDEHRDWLRQVMGRELRD